MRGGGKRSALLGRSYSHSYHQEEEEKRSQGIPRPTCFDDEEEEEFNLLFRTGGGREKSYFQYRLKKLKVLNSSWEEKGSKYNTIPTGGEKGGREDEFQSVPLLKKNRGRVISVMSSLPTRFR